MRRDMEILAKSSHEVQRLTMGLKKLAGRAAADLTGSHTVVLEAWQSRFSLDWTGLDRSAAS